MDQSEQARQQQQPPAVGFVAASNQMAIPPYQMLPVVAAGTPATAISSPSQPAATFPNPTHTHQLAQQQAQHFQHQQQAQHFQHQQQQQHEQLQVFWANQMQEIEESTDFKNHSLPLARIKKIMKADEDVRMISAEAPLIFAKACEMFILELTLRAWIHTEENRRRTLQKNDIAAAISRTDVFDFLVDIIPRDEMREEGLGVTRATIPLMGSPADMPYYVIPPQQATGPAGMIMGTPADQAGIYGAQQQQPQPPLPFMPWPHPQIEHQQGKQQADS